MHKIIENEDHVCWSGDAEFEDMNKRCRPPHQSVENENNKCRPGHLKTENASLVFRPPGLKVVFSSNKVGRE